MLVCVDMSALAFVRGGRPFRFDIPPLSTLAVVLLVLSPSLPLVVFGEVLKEFICVPVSLPLVEVKELFIPVGMEVLMPTR